MDDCEDQGYSKIEDGCLMFKCLTWEPGAVKPTRPALVVTERYDHRYWTCPKCGGYYGEVLPNADNEEMKASAS